MSKQQNSLIWQMYSQYAPLERSLSLGIRRKTNPTRFSTAVGLSQIWRTKTDGSKNEVVVHCVGVHSQGLSVRLNNFVDSRSHCGYKLGNYEGTQVFVHFGKLYCMVPYSVRRHLKMDCA